MEHRSHPAAGLLLLGFLVLGAAARGGDAPKLLQPHPERELDTPYWVSASWAIRADGTVRDADSIGEVLANALTRELGRQRTAWWGPHQEWTSDEAPSSRTPVEDLGCEISAENEALLNEARRPARQSVFPPGDFRGWTAASDAVVLGTVAGMVPGFDHRGFPTTLVRLEGTEHLYPTRKYRYVVESVLLPYARFVVAEQIFCSPRFKRIGYYPEVGDRLLIAADLPADREGAAMTVMSLSRVIEVGVGGTLVTHGASDGHPVTFGDRFPETLAEAKARAWEVWRDGFVDVADTMGHEEFTRLWRHARPEAAMAVQSGCFALSAYPGADGWALQFGCDSPQRTRSPATTSENVIAARATVRLAPGRDCCTRP